MTPKQFFSSKILLVFLVVILLVFLPGFYKRLQEKKSLENKIISIDQKIKSISQENENAEKELSALNGGEQSEKVLRSVYILKKDDEEAMVIPDEFLELKDKETDNSLWQKIKNIF